MIKGYLVKDGRFKAWVYPFLVALPLLAGFLALCLGRIFLSPKDVVQCVLSVLQGDPVAPMVQTVLFQIRLPRILTAWLVGAGLTAAGLAFQAIFANPLATPDILGVSSAASLGAVIGILLSWPSLGLQALALIAGLVAVSLTIRLATKASQTSIIMLVLSGLVMSSLANALLALLKYTADPSDKLPVITYWLMGSFARASYQNLLLACPLVLVGIGLICLLVFPLNLLSLSEEEAASMGLKVRQTRLILILASTFITAASVSLCGQIGWIGLIIPHMARMLVGSNNVYTLPVGISLGAALMVLIEALSRTLSVMELPISILTALLGAPIFMTLIRQSQGSFAS